MLGGGLEKRYGPKLQNIWMVYLSASKSVYSGRSGTGDVDTKLRRTVLLRKRKIQNGVAGKGYKKTKTRNNG